ncbi:GNAT family N-acetyltransferase [Flavobacterium piscis]|uniref:Ribosomal protein S18 acetylase RimI-like enzyme n=1 Tax=Flavobacterium piscis TaxID=1114874 RepID=A0ABU1Y3C9_9FLAO|nr:GNAT family N-acetyltransferase [Flavobacterium piscis]MDR7208663.1 ribosomal protein S18 acetylase RimI-like enzyme [Flavobacterium piscis]
MDLVVKNIGFRDIQENDLSILCEIYGSTRTEELERGTNWNEEQKKFFIGQQFFAQHEYYQKNYTGAKFYIIEKENIAIGRLYIDFLFEKKGVRIIDITLLPNWRQKNIGSSILAAIIKKAAIKNMNVTIHVESFNPAINLYKKLGFTKISETNGVYHLMEWSPK